MGTPSAATEFLAVRSRLSRSLESLSPRLRTAARYLLDEPDNVALHSMRAVAANAGVHPSTMVRLAREFDFASYNDLRDLYRGWISNQRSPFTVRARQLQRRRSSDDPALLLEELVAAAHTNLAASFGRTSPEQLAACAAAVAGASEVYVIGLRSCYPVAFHLYYALRLVLPRIHLLEGRGGALIDELRDIGARGLVIAISVAPYTRETVRAVRYAASRDAAVIALTDSATAPIAGAAMQTIVFDNTGPTVLHSIVSALAIAEALAAFVVARGGGTSLALVRRSEQQLIDFETYVEVPGRRARRRASR